MNDKQTPNQCDVKPMALTASYTPQNSGWIGVDLDGTLAEYHGFTRADEIGKPIHAMVEMVKRLLLEGRDVRIFTARGSIDAADRALAYPAIERWCKEHVWKVLPITFSKDIHMDVLYDDRAVRVLKNTGALVGGNIMDEIAAELTRARRKFPDAIACTTALTEEVGELSKALLDECPERVRKEAIQVAVMAIRVATEGDSALEEIRRRHGLESMVSAARP